MQTISAKELGDAPLVMRERGSGSRHVVEEAFRRAGMRLGSLRIAMELDSTEAILSCVEAGLGVGFASEWAVIRRTAAGTVATLRLRGEKMLRSFSFAIAQSPELPEAAATMMRFLQTNKKN